MGLKSPAATNAQNTNAPMAKRVVTVGSCMVTKITTATTNAQHTQAPMAQRVVAVESCMVTKITTATNPRVLLWSVVTKSPPNPSTTSQPLWVLTPCNHYALPRQAKSSRPGCPRKTPTDPGNERYACVSSAASRGRVITVPPDAIVHFSKPMEIC